jgi:predicted HicB family RNase H-like nuclease
MPVRFSPEDRKRVRAAAKASNKNVSEWIRSTLAAAIGA